MKKRDLERALRLLGWWLKREGGNHEIWTNGDDVEPVPRHNDVNEILAKKILRTARNRPRIKEGTEHETDGT